MKDSFAKLTKPMAVLALITAMTIAAVSGCRGLVVIGP